MYLYPSICQTYYLACTLLMLTRGVKAARGGPVHAETRSCVTVVPLDSNWKGGSRESLRVGYYNSVTLVVVTNFALMGGYYFLVTKALMSRRQIVHVL